MSLGSRRLDRAAGAGCAPVALLVRLLRGPLSLPDRSGARHTLLAVCPNSHAVARAALDAAQEARTPLLFAATLNQVDRDGGYTGWTPRAFAAFVEEEVNRLSIDVPVFLGLDHGGPWAKDGHVRRSLGYDAAMTAAKRSITACIEAGYDLLHLDPSHDPRRADGTPVPIRALVERTLTLMHHAESVRRKADRDPVAYEVGTEEVSPEGTGEERLRAFIRQLAEALDATGLPAPSFVVGDIGTRLHTAAFDEARARRLTEAALREFGALLKGHYTDDVAAPEQYPLSGMGGANVGPGLSAVEADAHRELVGLANRLGSDVEFVEALRTAVVQSGRWQKWLRPDEEGTAFSDLSAERQRWLVDTGSRYVWTRPAVQDARAALYEHVAPYRNAEAYVGWRLKTAILRYMHAFNLVGLADRLFEALSNDVP